MARDKVLVVDQNIDHLLKIYLALVHRKFNTRACNNPQEIPERLKQFRPAVIIVNASDYSLIMEKLKIPAIVLVERESNTKFRLNDGDILLKKPVSAEALGKAVEKLV